VIVLAIETATTACGVGLRTASGVEVVTVLDTERRHTEVLSAGIAQMLTQAALGPRDVTRVVVDRGPGLFTGLRVGIATASAFAQALGCELVEVTSLELLAHGAYDAGVRGRLVAAVDGRRGELFVQTFNLDEQVESVNEPVVARPRDVVIEWATSGAPVTFSGDGVARYVEDFAAVPKGELFAQSVPSLHAALELGAQREPSSVVTPLYLREADAIANFTTRERHP
jgi:tRNA threonylcarbamoyladenosine biosynthesis protein TsaB